MPKSVPKCIVFSNVGFVSFWLVSGCMLASLFDVF